MYVSAIACMDVYVNTRAYIGAFAGVDVCVCVSLIAGLNVCVRT